VRVAGSHGLVAGSRGEEVMEQTWCAAAGSSKDHQSGSAERQSVCLLLAAFREGRLKVMWICV